MKKKPNKNLAKKPVPAPPTMDAIPAAKHSETLIAQHKRVKETMPDGYHLLWDQIGEERDTNETIRLNMNQVQMHLQVQEKQYWERKAHLDKQLLEVMEDKGYDSADYRAEYTRQMKELSIEHKYTIELIRVSTSLAKEYRQCAMAKRLVVPVALVRKLMGAITSILHRFIHDENTLNQIGEAMSDELRMLFPTNAGSD